MNISLKWIKRLRWLSIFIISIPINLLISSLFDIHFWDWQYWVLSLPAQHVLNSWIDKKIEYLYDKRMKRKLRFKEYINDKKSGASI